ncbi:MAG: hypothetical protein ABJB17_07050 [Burkholderiales bacterium]
MNTLAFTTTSPADPELERNGYNAAFGELGLEWFWDTKTYDALAAIQDPKRRIGVYIQANHPHLLRAYQVDFLATAVETTRARVITSRSAIDLLSASGRTSAQTFTA